MSFGFSHLDFINMGLFSKKFFSAKATEDKKTDKKSAKVSDVLTSSAQVKKKSMKDLYEEKSSSAPSVAKAMDGKKAMEDKKDLKDGKAGKKSENKKYGNAYKILVRPLITEKASIQGTQNKYFFEVNIDANKIEIAKAIQDVYGIMPIKVNVIKMGGKNVRQGRTMGKRKNWKKAIVTLKAGESIKVYEGV